MKKKSDYIELGGCSKAHGIKGAFSFHLYNKEDSVLEKGSCILLVPENESCLPAEGEVFEIKSISFGNKVISFLKGIDNRSQVEEMTPFKIYFRKDELPELEEGEFYLEDVVGLRVIDELSGEEVGKISSHYDNTAQTILVVKGKRNFEVPFVDHFVKEVNLEDGFIRLLVPQFIGG